MPHKKKMISGKDVKKVSLMLILALLVAAAVVLIVAVIRCDVNYNSTKDVRSYLTLTKHWNVWESLFYFAVPMTLFGLYAFHQKRQKKKTLKRPLLVTGFLLAAALGGITYAVKERAKELLDGYSFYNDGSNQPEILPNKDYKIYFLGANDKQSGPYKVDKKGDLAIFHWGEQQEARNFADQVRACGGKISTVSGHSLGGSSAIIFAERYDGRIALLRTLDTVYADPADALLVWLFKQKKPKSAEKWEVIMPENYQKKSFANDIAARVQLLLMRDRTIGAEIIVVKDEDHGLGTTGYRIY